MNELARLLTTRIARTGPITIAEYMAECLLHPTLGYYSTRDPFGRVGDFITAPEISQMFGELIGLALAQTWLDQGAPSEFALVELGPGRGTLMADILRATKSVAGFHEAATVCLVEASAKLRAEQIKAVPNAKFYDSISDVPPIPVLVVANEFFDALPIRQFVRAQDGWSERVIGVESDELVFGLTAAAPLDFLAHRLAETKIGDLVEYCGALPAICQDLGTRISRNGGAALIIDYGDWASLGDTLQALKSHEKIDPLETPGEADITAHVDFAAIAMAAKCAHTRLTPQGVFLERLGITARAQALATKLSGEALDTHISAHRRLTHPSEMGDLFKVIGLYPTIAAPPPGLNT